MPSDEALTGIGELIFSLLIGYLGALECALVVRHLYHCTFQHSAYTATDAAADNEELPRLRERLEKEIAEAAEREARSGTKAMQDGVLYDNKGLRVDPEGDKRAALAAELERQRQIEEETRRQLAEAQARLAEDRRKAKEADEKMIEQQREERRQREENERKLIEAEKQREAEQKQREEQQRKLQAAEEQREREENERKLIEAEREREANERRNQEAEEQQERQENEQRLIEAEQRRLEAERQRELEEAETEESERRLFEAEVRRERDVEDQEQRDAEIVERLLAAERARKMSATESELEEEALEEESRRLLSGRVDAASKQKMIEENARLFLEAEEEMVMLQQRQLQAAHSREDEAEYAGAVPVEEELCVKKILPPRLQEPEAQEEPMVVHKVKTQYRQSKGPSFPGVSDEGSSLEPNSSQQSSFSTQPSEDLLRTEEERPEPEGEDHTPDMQYTEDYLRSLDGIKSRPLMREDGSGRRRAFKKRRSSGSSNSSRDSRASRDEELKMFTSLEEEELRHGDREDYNPIKYTSEPTLRVKSHHRRHKRSPAKDMMPPPEAEASGVSLEMLGEESTNPWGEVMPEHYKDTEFWKREKALSIDEEEFDLDLSKNEQKSSSFEDATDAQNEEAATALLQQRAKEQPEDTNKAAESSASSDNKSNTCS
ncbi:trichohyalin isoform X5 [Drosophila guanche]|uniref:trichohyalin isoform X5 n=1 Tax=Drosophila guanche TaxID=7266 RepID=UPI00147239A1|nr:trichohyalin isoform X5 [Drosophila guanche]